MELLKKNLEIIAISAGELIIGILLLINPADFTKGLIMVIGTLMLVRAVISFIAFAKANITKLNENQDLFSGLLFLSLGLFFLFNTLWFISTFPALTILFGVAAFVVGLEKAQWCGDRLRLKQEKWYFKGISALVAVIVGIVSLVNPFGDINANWIFTGIAFIVMAVSDVAFIFLERPTPAVQVENPTPVKEEVKVEEPEKNDAVSQ